MKEVFLKPEDWRIIIAYLNTLDEDNYDYTIVVQDKDRNRWISVETLLKLAKGYE